MSDTKYVLEATEITKTFPGVKALDKVSLRVRPGTVHALMGENGAGKSTLMKCIYGIYSPDEGNIRVGGEETQIHNPRMAMDLGISMIHQELHPVRPQTVAENIFLGRIPYKKTAGIRWVDKEKLVSDTQKVFDRLGLDIDPKQKVEELSTSYCQLIEIARAVSFGAKIIIMDEPTLGIDPEGMRELLNLMRELSEQDGRTLLISSHQLHQIQQVCDRVGIFVDGKLIACGKIEELAEQVQQEGNYVLETAAVPDDGGFKALLNDLGNVRQVERQGDVYVVRSRNDVRRELLRRSLDQGYTLSHLRLRGGDLDEIYRRYFEKSDEKAGKSNEKSGKSGAAGGRLAALRGRKNDKQERASGDL